MLTSTNTINSPVRAITAKVELYNGSTLVDTFSYNDNLKSVEIERVGEESKFFGFGVCQKVNIKLIDIKRLINLTTDNYFKVYFRSTEAEYVNNFPKFYITEVNRDENTNELSITAYDGIKRAEAHAVAEVELTSYTVQEFAAAMSYLTDYTGLVIKGLNEGETCFNTSYAEGANFEGTETFRETLNAIAEITQTIYYLDGNDNLVFKRLSSGEADLTISKSQYITLDSSTNRRLAAITHATELGDNITAAMEITGTTQYIRNNPFWDLREDIATLLNNAIAAVGGLTINQFNCSWRGNYLLEVGDKIDLVTKDNDTVSSYVINDVITYSGAFSEKTQWSYTESDSETDSNPSTLGEALKQTFAKVDKANKTISILTSDIAADRENISSLELTTEAISGKVSSIEETTAAALEGVSEDVATLSQAVETKLTDEDVTIKISEALSNGVDKVETSTGFTFNDTGLSVSKSDSEMTTTITENGMTVYKNNEAVLTADNTGVNAQNLHATTYLIIGNNSRLEDYGSGRTGCFWIGG
jgi:hypothetical protein